MRFSVRCDGNHSFIKIPKCKRCTEIRRVNIDWLEVQYVEHMAYHGIEVKKIMWLEKIMLIRWMLREWKK